jgi:high-affinity iron transporter
MRGQSSLFSEDDVMRTMRTWMVLLAVACGGGEAPKPAETPSAPAVAPAHPHAGHAAGHAGHAAAHAGGSHMEQMAANRSALREALGPAYDAPVPGLDAADAGRGKVVYDASCASCHGPAGKGDGPAGAGLQPPPADFTDAFHARYYSDAGRVHVIEKGAPGTDMPAFEGQLGHQQILDVYAYVRSLRAPAAQP